MRRRQVMADCLFSENLEGPRMFRKLIVFALTSGLAAKAYRAYAGRKMPLADAARRSGTVGAPRNPAGGTVRVG